jgi:hypothetical protein
MSLDRALPNKPPFFCAKFIFEKKMVCGCCFVSTKRGTIELSCKPNAAISILLALIFHCQPVFAFLAPLYATKGSDPFLKHGASKFRNLCCTAEQEGINFARDFHRILLKKREEIGSLNIEKYNQKPSALLPPHRVVQIQLEALQMNDWPEEDAGCRHAYRFALRACNSLFGPADKPFVLKPGEADPADVSKRLYVDPHTDNRHIVQSWLGPDRLEDEPAFVATLKRHFPRLIGAASFAWAGPPQFGPTGAACAVSAAVRSDGDAEPPRVFVFDLVRVDDGAYKDCW